MRHQERIEDRENVRLSTWSVLQLLFAEVFVKYRLIGNWKHDITDIYTLREFYFYDYEVL